ncbi:MAG: bifunctional riboflavin kinase/FAD synthetase [Gammaproteobacteria bacterium]|nr:bifunctional riboflavin kinase/FAD synthetase [Gammaproteobacteria bacterium]MDE2263546.1 bifunctional riboflavin kinase/FAD synthetase [Gammaproteobacteria bacterium]
MELIRGLKGLNGRHRGSVVTIGTFDGMHLGHQALLTRLKEHGGRLSRPTMVLTFEPMPREFLLAEGLAPARLTSCRERWRILARLGCDFLWLLRFGPWLRNLSGEEFAGLLGKELGTPLVVVGHDFRFGRNGEATAATLSAAGRRLGFEVDVVPPVTIDGERVSSSGVRDALARADFEQVRRWLGRPYSMTGRVVQGNRLGRSLGFPTANLQIERRRPPVQGIFAVRVHGASEAALPGVASLGTRPTVDGEHTLLEAHVFDFSGDLYGREIEVEFVAKLREEERFPSLDALTAQMHKDAARARDILG